MPGVTYQTDPKQLGRNSRAGSASTDQSIDAQPARSVEQDEQENETVNHCWFAVILNREKTTRGMKHKIADRHFTAGEKRANPGQKTKGNKQTADQLNPGAEQHQALASSVAARRKP